LFFELSPHQTRSNFYRNTSSMLEIVHLYCQILYPHVQWLRHRSFLSIYDRLQVFLTWKNSLICSSSTCIYFGLRTNWIAKNDQMLLFQPLKKFDFPEPFTPTTNHSSPISITNCVYSRLEQLWIFRSRIAPEALNNHLFDIHLKTIFGDCSSFGGKQHEKGVSSTQSRKRCNSTTSIQELALHWFDLLRMCMKR